MQFLIIANQVRNLQYPLASLNWREVAREARQREFSTAAAVYNKLIIPKEYTLFSYKIYNSNSNDESNDICNDICNDI